MARTTTTTRGPARRVGHALARGVGAPAGALGRRIRRTTHAGGAGESGLAKLIELHAVNSAGDMMITVALASTVFFSVPSGEARGRVALYLLVTMAPFALLAPVIGPLLDRLQHGRRAAMAMAMMARAVLAWTMAGVISTAGLGLYPAALGVLVASKAYGVVRSAVVPRLLPGRTTLVKANSRVTLSGLLATAVAAPVGAGLNVIGPQWPLYGAFVVFICGALLSLSLPGKVDSARGEQRVRLSADEEAPPEPSGIPGRKPGLLGVGSSVLHALQGNGGLRSLSGFLTMFLAFMMREHPLGGLTPAMSLGVVGVAAGVGNAFGTALGAWLKARGPEVIIATVLVCALSAATIAAGWYSLVTVATLTAVAGISQALAKLSLDALIQRDVPEMVRTSAFARSETALQLSWVVGGGLGILLPLNGPLGMACAAGLVLVAFLLSVRGLLGAARRGSTARARVA
ncbi:MFS transporter [Actinacidiphila bryophytorum]|uniref:Major Facilitator Superfamily protein n=1 Tax=Actinacidiphila bryophytorum TaxID=1436133 RepID=A0A9W4MB83_9ACTN|nr:MFS transporter [Actinacidiphila bryophytorum]MBM9439447.1 MFS transporter [Actinacidiphila bryophytorum]MBN6545731.1 MFS transporter [Actinacidiphila bryophytorum]CAG7639491.1 Major Facilitator Superfamily protein [Actinacidiphila bryophytorum]